MWMYEIKNSFSKNRQTLGTDCRKKREGDFCYSIYFCLHSVLLCWRRRSTLPPRSWRTHYVDVLFFTFFEWLERLRVYACGQQQCTQMMSKTSAGSRHTDIYPWYWRSCYILGSACGARVLFAPETMQWYNRRLSGVAFSLIDVLRDDSHALNHTCFIVSRSPDVSSVLFCSVVKKKKNTARSRHSLQCAVPLPPSNSWIYNREKKITQRN
jgi:hypothetical protein